MPPRADDDDRNTEPPSPFSAGSTESAWAQELEQAFASTHWVWKRVIVKPPAGPTSTVERSSSLRSRWAQRDLRTPLTCTIKLRGGPEAWCEIKTGSRVYRVHGATAIYDVLRLIHHQT